VSEYARGVGVSVGEAFVRGGVVLRDVALVLFRLNVPVVTFGLLPQGYAGKDRVEVMDALASFFEGLSSWPVLRELQVKVTVLGKWYDLPGGLVEQVKRVLEETRDFDRFFLNVCVEYDGQEEIVDACRLVARQVKVGKLDVDAIDRQVIKENVYASYFPPPEIIVKTGRRRSLQGLLLWDSALSDVVFVDRPFPALSREDVFRAIADWQKRAE
jgi:tritrans,polycis-undecaprenyl-diphosphate synthase [geranylgeranyl-diphosphate specific]